MKEFVCGVKIEAENLNEALVEVLPVPKLVEKAMFSESLHCIESPSIGVDFVVTVIIVSFVMSTLFGYFLGRKK